ncbi:MAG TPA: hypothetical protein DCO77_07755 [Nitrospiraceae bacterium]|nr:hypothetical protein [Nitrospiraceae bacterium]
MSSLRCFLRRYIPLLAFDLLKIPFSCTDSGYHLVQGKSCLAIKFISKSLAFSALVIHAGIDDYASEPAGNVGPRIACGAIKTGLGRCAP